jgi:hypothetical protein
MSGFYSNLLTKNISMGTAKGTSVPEKHPPKHEEKDVKPPSALIKEVPSHPSLAPPVEEKASEVPQVALDKDNSKTRKESHGVDSLSENPSAKFARRHDETAISDARARYLARKNQPKTSGS